MKTKKLLTTGAAALLMTAFAAAQGGDDCVNATPISGYGLYAWDNTSATPSGVNDCNGLPVRKDLWFVWTAPANALVRYETCNTTTAFDTRIAVYDGANCSALNLITCAGANCMGQSRLTFDAIAGQSYLMRTGSRNVGQGGPGQIRLIADPCPPTLDDALEDNDVCVDAVALGNGVVNNLWCSKTDPDWYSFCVAGGDTLTMDVLFTTSTGDIDIFASDDCAQNGNIGIGGSATDNEQIVYMNPGTTDVTIYLRVELWGQDPNNDCNNYSMMISGANGTCTGTPIGTNYCQANANSTGTIGLMAAVGSEVVSDNNVTLQASSLPQNSFSFFITSQTTGFVMNPAGSAGNLCVLGNIGRYVGPGQIQNAGGMGMIALPINLTQIPQPNGFVSVAAGESWSFQAWYRDVVGGVASSNFTNGLTITFM